MISRSDLPQLSVELLEEMGIPFECFEDDRETQEEIEKKLIHQLDLYSKEKKLRSIIIKKGVVV